MSNFQFFTVLDGVGITQIVNTQGHNNRLLVSVGGTAIAQQRLICSSSVYDELCHCDVIHKYCC